LCYAKYVRLFVRSGAVVLLPVSYVAPVYSVTDFLYPDDTNGAVHDLRQWVETPEVAEVEKLAQLVLTRLQMTYVPWNDPSLDEPVHRSVPRSNVRDFLFHFEDYD
jgi:hypothetical protein